MRETDRDIRDGRCELDRGVKIGKERDELAELFAGE